MADIRPAKTMAAEWRVYTRKGMISARPWTPDYDMTRVSVSPADLELPTLEGGYIAQNPDNFDDQWYIAADYFAKHYEVSL